MWSLRIISKEIIGDGLLFWGDLTIYVQNRQCQKSD